jgi:UDPglucose--hexose-1-phosphate uridylyltransferase
MDTRHLVKPDGRSLTLYSRGALTADFTAPSPSLEPHTPNPHLRWHPLRAEWIAYAGHRQHRTFLPPPGYNPLAPSAGDHSVEVPAGDWEVAVFDNLFPTFVGTASPPPPLEVPTKPARGCCEVVVFAQDPQASLGALPLSHVELIVDVWADRYESVGRRADVEYVFPFENRGVEVGVTLHHPHGQIYGYPFVPPVASRTLTQERLYFDQHQRGLMEDLVATEVRSQVRLVYRGPHAVAFMPSCARYAYELWVVPYRRAPSLAALTGSERQDFARALKTVLLKFDALWQRPFPYVLVIHQAPTDGLTHYQTHVRLELYPAYRMPGRLKYLAGSELGAGVFTADTVPEETVKELQAVVVDVDA